MKSFIRAITFIIVLTLLPTGSIPLLTAQETAAEVANVVADTPVSSPSNVDALVQLSTVLSAQTQQHGGEKVLVIPNSQIQPQDMATLMEDMTVMCRIFDKKLAQSSLIPETPVWVRLSSRYSSMGDRSMGAMYIQGYGALFMINVDFPLSPPPKTEEKEETDQEDTDPVWEQMKQEIFLPQQHTRHTSGGQEKQYDATKVKNLKDTLIKALVHAANIRGFEPDESVIITVTGSGISSNFVSVKAVPGHNQVMVTYKDKDKHVTKLLTSPSLNDLDIASTAVMTIRAKKSYIDALVQNKIDYDEFEQKIQILLYPSLSQNIGSSSSPFFRPARSTGFSRPSSSSIETSENRSVNRRSSAR